MSVQQTTDTSKPSHIRPAVGPHKTLQFLAECLRERARRGRFLGLAEAAQAYDRLAEIAESATTAAAPRMLLMLLSERFAETCKHTGRIVLTAAPLIDRPFRCFETWWTYQAEILEGQTGQRVTWHPVLDDNGEPYAEDGHLRTADGRCYEWDWDDEELRLVGCCEEHAGKPGAVE